MRNNLYELGKICEKEGHIVVSDHTPLYANPHAEKVHNGKQFGWVTQKCTRCECDLKVELTDEYKKELFL